jgi:hypothetical protein
VCVCVCVVVHVCIGACVVVHVCIGARVVSAESCEYTKSVGRFLVVEEEQRVTQETTQHASQQHITESVCACVEAQCE